MHHTRYQHFFPKLLTKQSKNAEQTILCSYEWCLFDNLLDISKLIVEKYRWKKEKCFVLEFPDKKAVQNFLMQELTVRELL